MEINLQEYRNKIDLLSNLETEVYARTSAINMIINIINAFLSVHTLTQEEIMAIQSAIEAENNYTQTLADLLAKNLGNTPKIAPDAPESVSEGTPEGTN